MSTERLLATFLDLVRIDSPSGREAAMAARCSELLEGIGFSVRTDASAALTGSNTGNLIADLPGTRSGAPTLLFSAHLDCVQPCEGVEPILEDGMVVSAGDTVLGADDKAGIAAIVEGVLRSVESGSPRGDIRVVLTVAEEMGLRGAKALDHAEIGADLCLVLDADGDPGGIVIGAPAHDTFVATFHGLGAHAGVAPEQGRSALLMAARAVAAMPSGRLDDRTTANVGTIEGGTATNVVPARVSITGECRSLDSARVDEVASQMESVMRDAASSGGGRVDVQWTREYESFGMAADAPELDIVREACADTGLEPRSLTTGGGSDGNIFAAAGIPTLVLSCGMQGLHSVDERIAVADLEALTSLVTAIIARAQEHSR